MTASTPKGIIPLKKAGLQYLALDFVKDEMLIIRSNVDI